MQTITSRCKIISEKILVVAFDGMDKELIEEFNLENIQQEEFGKIDNQTGMKYTYTSELFASFITGTNWEEHGIVKLGKTSRKIEMINKLETDRNIPGLWRIRDALKGFFDVGIITKHWKGDLQVDTIFEEVDNSRAMFIPSYEPSIFWRSNCGGQPFKFGYDHNEAYDHFLSREHSFRKRKLKEEIENEFLKPRNLLMCHFHRPDMSYHHFDYRDKNYDHDHLYEIYSELDELAGEIKEKALDAGYDYVIFMSDHGLQTEESHNENAFYSSNQCLFPKSFTPKITDFHDLFIEITDDSQ